MPVLLLRPQQTLETQNQKQKQVWQEMHPDSSTPPPIARLNPDTLIHIFTLTLQEHIASLSSSSSSSSSSSHDDDSSDQADFGSLTTTQPPWTLAQVNTTWRTLLTHHCPLLWSTITISLGPRSPTWHPDPSPFFHTLLTRLQLQLHRTHTAPSLKITFERSFEPQDDLSLPLFWRVLWPHRARWRELRIARLVVPAIRLDEESGADWARFPELRTLSVEFGSERETAWGLGSGRVSYPEETYRIVARTYRLFGLGCWSSSSSSPSLSSSSSSSSSRHQPSKTQHHSALRSLTLINPPSLPSRPKQTPAFAHLSTLRIWYPNPSAREDITSFLPQLTNVKSLEVRFMGAGMVPGEVEHGVGRPRLEELEDFEDGYDDDGHGCIGGGGGGGDRNDNDGGDRIDRPRTRGWGDVCLADHDRDERVMRLRAILPNLVRLRLQRYPTHGGMDLLHTLLIPNSSASPHM